jgi:hypothetical protein
VSNRRKVCFRKRCPCQCYHCAIGWVINRVDADDVLQHCTRMISLKMLRKLVLCGSRANNQHLPAPKNHLRKPGEECCFIRVLTSKSAN